jgi:hypothetical protein
MTTSASPKLAKTLEKEHVRPASKRLFEVRK